MIAIGGSGRASAASNTSIPESPPSRKSVSSSLMGSDFMIASASLALAAV